MTAKGINLLWALFSFAWIVLETEVDSFEEFKKKPMDYPEIFLANGDQYYEYLRRSRNMEESNIFIHLSEKDLKQYLP